MARGIENPELNERIRKAWSTGRYKTYSSLAKVFRTYPNKIKRAVEAVENGRVNTNAI